MRRHRSEQLRDSSPTPTMKSAAHKLRAPRRARNDDDARGRWRLPDRATSNLLDIFERSRKSCLRVKQPCETINWAAEEIRTRIRYEVEDPAGPRIKGQNIGCASEGRIPRCRAAARLPICLPANREAPARWHAVPDRRDKRSGPRPIGDHQAIRE
jgi:hypothetical protein